MVIATSDWKEAPRVLQHQDSSRINIIAQGGEAHGRKETPNRDNPSTSKMLGKKVRRTLWSREKGKCDVHILHSERVRTTHLCEVTVTRTRSNGIPWSVREARNVQMPRPLRFSESVWNEL